MTRARLALPALLLAATGGVLAGCADDDPVTADGAEDAVRDYLESFSDRDYDEVCDAWTEDNQERSIEEWNSTFGGDEPVDTCEQLLRQGVILAEAFGEDLDVEVDSVSSELTGEKTAEVAVEYRDDSGEATFLLVHEDGAWLIDDETDADAAESGSLDEPTVEPSEDVTTVPATPTPVGDPASLAGCTVTITDVDTNAGPELREANEFNDSASARYVMVTYSATYDGSERTADATSDLSWTLTGSDAVVLDPASVVTPSESENAPTEVRPGGTVELQVVFDVDPAIGSSGLLSMSAYTDEGEEYVDFQL